MASSDTTIIPRIDPTHYTWSPHPSVPFLYVRRALGAETKWAHIPTANRQLFVTGKITKLTESTSQAALFFAARKAWMRMRFEYPEVVQKHSGDFNSDGSAIMQCEVPKDDADAEAWVQRTLHTCTDPVDETAAMTAAEEELRKQETTDPVSVRLHSINSPPERGTSRATRSAFSMRVDHGLADGMGVYLLIGKYFQLLGEELGGREGGPLDWTKASDRIPKAWMELLDDEQKTKGQDFEESVRRNMDLIMDSVVSANQTSRPCLKSKSQGSGVEQSVELEIPTQQRIQTQIDATHILTLSNQSCLAVYKNRSRTDLLNYPPWPRSRDDDPSETQTASRSTFRSKGYHFATLHERTAIS